MTTIYTIGYGNRMIGDFVRLLHHHKITVLADVRSKPFSRFNPDYSRTALEKQLKDAGLKYLFTGHALGGKPSNTGLYTNGMVNYELIRNQEEYKQAIEELVRIARQGETVCIMCSELDPAQCHRKNLLADDLIRHGVKVIHIDAKGKAVEHQDGLQNKLF